MATHMCCSTLYSKKSIANHYQSAPGRARAIVADNVCIQVTALVDQP